MTEGEAGRAIAVGGPLIALVVFTLFAFSYLLSDALGFPPMLTLPVVVRLVGSAIALAGLGVMVWVFKRRTPANVIVSTYFTFSKMFGRTPIAEMGGRTEQLVVDGPQRYVRNPLYFGVVVMVLGWALLTGYAFVFIAALVILLWFSLVIIPFEERELRALFGEQWKRYSEETPMLFPFTKRKKHTRPPSS